MLDRHLVKLITLLLLGHFCPAVPKAIKTMSRGEKVNLIVQPQCKFPYLLLVCLTSS